MREKESVFQRMYGTFVGLVQVPEILDNCSDTCIERKPQWLAGICDRGNKFAGKLAEAIGLKIKKSKGYLNRGCPLKSKGCLQTGRPGRIHQQRAGLSTVIMLKKLMTGIGSNTKICYNQNQYKDRSSGYGI
ncbi:hypothetical protein [Ruminococcus sp. SR1/5]|uniref:hypothetical protein n=1 Tax=Ruminococcus sp. SR1/5 TaxID=657323 RepID=UPI0001CD488A|nr:hypothetical protein [Ruminococcus sp. SR1/5]CBL21234.1 hypothetical protein CK1_34700 [Ruminococcus sp. SR1/5]